MKRRVGDTLVEVSLAIGIFSMVAIAVVAVMTGGTSSVETALETTLAREEIDVQAEALRFIHSAYVTGIDASIDDPYIQLWDKIIDNAIDPATDGTDYLNYSPQTCQEVQNSDVLKNHGFIINPRALNTNPANAYVGYSSNYFKPAATFPRLIYSAEEASSADSLIGSTTSSNLYRAEGIYVIAVKDSNSTQIVGSTSPSRGSGFYDFYIRTCWYGTGADTPTAISTVMRLYSPPDTVNRNKSRVTIIYMSNGGPSVPVVRQTVYPGESVYIPRYENNAGFVGWSLRQDLTGGNVSWENNLCKVNNFGNVTAEGDKCKYTAPNLSSNSIIYLYAMWNEEITIKLSWTTAHRDLDSHVHGVRTDGQSFTAFYNNKAASFIPGQPAIATLNIDCTGSCREEIFKINTLGGDKYYYYVDNYSDKNSNITSATVTVTSSGKLNLNRTFTASNAVGEGGTWNVFAFINDKIIPCETRSAFNSPNITYTSPCRPFIISFNGNGSTSGSMANQSINFGSSAKLAGNAFSRTGYTFKGWNTSANGNGQSYANGATFVAPASTSSTTTITLYAQWEKIQYPANQKYYMQDFTIDHCASLASTGDYTIYDHRDEKPYTVRHIDNVCWMTQDLSIYQNLQSSQSNFTNPASFPMVTLSSETMNTISAAGNSIASVCQACASSPNPMACAQGCQGYIAQYLGGYAQQVMGTSPVVMAISNSRIFYNPVAAWVGSSYDGKEKAQDICPKGWKIASSQNYQSIFAAKKASLLRLSTVNYVSNFYLSAVNSGYYLTSSSGISVSNNNIYTPYNIQNNGPTYSIRCVVK